MRVLGTRLGTRLPSGFGSDGGGGEPTLPELFADLFTPQSYWFDADSYAHNGTKVTDWIDRIDGSRTLSCSVDAQRALIPTADAGMNGAMAARFLGGQLYISSEAPSVWSFLNNTPATIVFVLKPTDAAGTNIVVETRPAGNTNGVLVTGSTTSITAALYRASGGGQSIGTLASAWTVGVPRMYVLRLGTSNSPNGRLAATGISAADYATIAGATGTCTQALCFGARVGLVVPMNANWRSLYIYDRWVSDEELQLIAEFVESETGIPA